MSSLAASLTRCVNLRKFLDPSIFIALIYKIVMMKPTCEVVVKTKIDEICESAHTVQGTE